MSVSPPNLQVVSPAEPPNLPTPPHAVAAEQGLLGALLHNNDLWAEVEEALSAEHFYDKRHIVIFSAIQKLASERHADVRLLYQELKNADRLAAAGGEEYIYELTQISAAPANIPAYAEQIKQTAMLRAMMRVLQETNARILHPKDATPNEILDEAEAHLGEVSNMFDDRGGGLRNATEELRTFFDDLTEVVNTEDFNRLLGAMTGYSKLDKMTTGLHGGDLVIIAGRPGSGKTAFALNLIRHVSAIKNSGVAVFSLEMSSRHLVMRLISQDHLDMQKLRTGKDHKGKTMNSDDLRIFASAVSDLGERNIYIDDSGVLSVLETKSRARRVARQLVRQGNKLSMIVVDYLQLLSPTLGGGNENRAMEVATISRGLKALAKELNVPVVALSQLNRSVESRTSKEPVLSDLRESGAIEQDADIVMFLHEERSNEGDFSAPPAAGVPVKLIIGKQRNGPVGKISLNFRKQYSRFSEVASPDAGDGEH